MADIASYGLRSVVSWARGCATPGCPCKSDRKHMLSQINRALGPSQQLDAATYDAICLDLDTNPLPERPETSTSTSTGEKQRDDGNFDRVVEQAFKAFRDQERETALDAPEGSTADNAVKSNNDNKFWIGAAHLRHHLDLLLVLKEVKPCLIFFKYAAENDPLWSTVAIDCLIPIMDRFDLWSYGFRISYKGGVWVFYDSRSPKMPLITKAFLVHGTVKIMDPVAYPEDAYPHCPDHEAAEALGYPAPFDDWRSGRFVTIRDHTELAVLASRGWPEDKRCCVQGMAFTCPPGDESVWKKVVDFHRRVYDAAKSVGTELILSASTYPEMTAWLKENPGVMHGLPCLVGCTHMSNPMPTAQQFLEALNDADWDNITFDDLSARLARIGLRLPVPVEDDEDSNDSV